MLGSVTRRPDPADRRAKLVYTDRGVHAFHSSRAVVATLERQTRQRLGRTRYDQLRQALAAAAEQARDD